MAEYIGREDILKILHAARYNCVYNREYMMSNGTLDVYKWLKTQIDKLPAADVRPVVRGKWIIHDKGWWRLRNGNIATDWHSYLLSVETFKEVCDIDSTFSKAETEWKPDYECSACGSRAWEDEYDYCPNCGAKMESGGA